MCIDTYLQINQNSSRGQNLDLWSKNTIFTTLKNIDSILKYASMLTSLWWKRNEAELCCENEGEWLNWFIMEYLPGDFSRFRFYQFYPLSRFPTGTHGSFSALSLTLASWQSCIQVFTEQCWENCCFAVASQSHDELFSQLCSELYSRLCNENYSMCYFTLDWESLGKQRE